MVRPMMPISCAVSVFAVSVSSVHGGEARAEINVGQDSKPIYFYSTPGMSDQRVIEGAIKTQGKAAVVDFFARATSSNVPIFIRPQEERVDSRAVRSGIRGWENIAQSTSQADADAVADFVRKGPTLDFEAGTEGATSMYAAGAGDYPIKGDVKPGTNNRAWYMGGIEQFKVAVVGCTPVGGCITDNVTASVTVNPGAVSSMLEANYYNGPRPDLSQVHFDSQVWAGGENWTLGEVVAKPTGDKGSGKVTWIVRAEQTLAGKKDRSPLEAVGLSLC